MNELETLLVKAAPDPVARPRFYQALVEATLYVLIPVPAAAGERTLEADERVQIVHWQDGERQIIPIFSSLELLNEAVQTVPGQYGYLGIRGRELFGMLSQAKTPAILNPNWSYGREFLANEIARLADGTFTNPAQTEIIERERKVLVGQPQEYPDKLVAALKRYFSGAPTVIAAYLALYVDAAVGPDPRLAVTIVGGEEARTAVNDAGVIAREIMKDGPAVDFVVVEDAGETPLSGGSAPFYERRVKPKV